MASVFIAGHGRMRRSGSVAVPAGVSIAWAVPPTYNGSGGLSTAFLSGAYDTWAGHTNAGEPYYDHYLCPDIAAIMANKAAALSQGNRTPRDDIYLLQPRLKFTTTLSSIVLFLKRRVPGPLQIYWTCCRSPIGEPSSRIRLFEGGTIRDEPAGGNVVADPGVVFSQPKISGKKVDQLLAQRDFRKVWTEDPVVVNDIDGGVTLKALTAEGFKLQTTWPGIDEAAVNKGRGRSGSMSGAITN
jgi:hypothetical protein